MLLVKPIYIKFTEEHGHSVRDMKLLPLSKKQGYSRFEDEDEEPQSPERKSGFERDFENQPEK